MYSCANMFRLKDDTPVRCGKCDNCRALQTAHWQFRIVQEEKRSLNALFVTLTYDTRHAPLSPLGFLTLDKTHIQYFMKRLRSFTERTDNGIREYESGKRKRRPKVQDNWLVGMPPIKYYAVGEYGHKFKRPHYHLILFNAHEDAVLNAWNIGQVHIGKVSGASIGYCLKYIRKRSWEGCFEGDDRQRVFSLSSKNLGRNYITPRTLHFHSTPENYYLALEGKIIPMSRYYRDRMFTDEQIEAVQELQAIRVQLQNQITEDEYFEKVYEAYACSQANINKPKKPIQSCNINFTNRKKTTPIKRSTQQVRPSRIRLCLLRNSLPVISGVYLYLENNPFTAFLNQTQKKTNFK